MKNGLKSLVLVTAAVLASASGFAQFAGSPPGMNPAWTKLFGSNTGFTSKAQFTSENPNRKQPVNMEMNFSMLDGKTRLEMDMTKMAGPGAAPQMKAMGMDQVVFISLPDRKQMLQIYPSLQGYVATPMPESQAAEAAKDYKIEKTSLGQETIDGHACEKNKVTLTDNKGGKKEFLTWNAKDLKDFPLRLQMDDQGGTVTMNYKDVKLDKPDSKLFDAPSGFTKYESQMDLMQGVMMKRRPGAPHQ